MIKVPNYQVLFYCFSISLAILVGACTGSKSLQSQRLSKIELRPYPSKFRVRTSIIHEGNTSYCLVQAPTMNYSLYLKIYDSFEGRVLLKEQYEEFKDSLTEVVHKVKLDVDAANFVVEAFIQNSNQQTLYSDILTANKTLDPLQSIFLVDAENKPILKNYFNTKETFKIKHRSDSVLSFFVKFYKEPQLPAPPPFSTNEGLFSASTTPYTQLYLVPSGKEIKFTQEGLYYIQLDTSTSQGIFVNCFDNSFPDLSKIEDLILAARYICKKEEYESMKIAKDQKIALDEFWLARNRKEKDAKNLIRKYYHAVQEANFYFTTYKEGWKTDRGIIYIIFGPPTVVRKYFAKEVWYYASTIGRYPVEFSFNRRGGQWVLERSADLREPWNSEVFKWRTGEQ